MAEPWLTIESVAIPVSLFGGLWIVADRKRAGVVSVVLVALAYVAQTWFAVVHDQALAAALFGAVSMVWVHLAIDKWGGRPNDDGVWVVRDRPPSNKPDRDGIIWAGGTRPQNPPPRATSQPHPPAPPERHR